MIRVEVFGQQATIEGGVWSLSGKRSPLAKTVLRDLKVSTEADILRGKYGTTSEPDVDLMAAKAAVRRMSGRILDRSKHGEPESDEGPGVFY